ncbi:MAG: hypothetical protein ACE5D4_07230 [Thermodesulfobacteriota bacterium]
MIEDDKQSGPEWSADEWTDEWTIHVGRAYACEACGNMVMVTKGGVGVLEPLCCDGEMSEVEKPDEIR